MFMTFTDTESVWIMANKQHLHKSLSDAIPVICRNGLPPSVSFRVEAVIGITVLDDEGREVAGEGNAAVLSFQQIVSSSGVVASQFGSNNPTPAVSDVGSTVSHTPRKRLGPKQKQTPAATVTGSFGSNDPTPAVSDLGSTVSQTPRKRPAPKQTSTAGVTVKEEYDGGREVAGEENSVVLSLQQIVSDSGVVASQFGSNDPIPAVSDLGSTVSQTPRKRPAPKQTSTARVTVKEEYDGGREVAGEENSAVLSLQQIVSDNGVVASQFGSKDPTPAVSDVGSSVSHTPRKRPGPKQKQTPAATVTGSFGSNDPTPAVSDLGSTVTHTPRKRPAPKQKQTSTAGVTVKEECAIETYVKQKYGAESYPFYATGHPPTDNTLEEYGTTDGAEAEYTGEEGEYGEGEDTEGYYEDDGKYCDDGNGYPHDVKFEDPDNSYMEGAGAGSYMQKEYMTKDGHSSAGRQPKSKAAKPRLSAAGAQRGTSRGRKPSGAGRGGTRPRAGNTSHELAAAIAV